MVDYHSCAHLLPESISKAIRKVKDVHGTCRFNDAGSVYHCLDCDCHGRLSDKTFKMHALNSGHTIGIRVKDPVELYCFVCQDFQFSSQFDRFTKKKRTRTGIYYSRFGPKATKAGMAGGMCGQVKGLCNMGATCFMSAVLQILMKNTILMNCDQMHMSVDRCKTIIERSVSIDNTSRQSGDSAVSQSVPSNPTCIYCEFKKICMETTREDSLETIVPANLLHAVWNELDYLAGYQQQDAHEFLIAFLDGLDQHLKLNHAPGKTQDSLTLHIPPPVGAIGVETSPTVRKSPRSEAKPRCFGYGGGQTPTPLRRSFSEQEPSSAGSAPVLPRVAELLQVFRGSLQSHLTCRACGHESIKNESFLDLSLSLNHCAALDNASSSGDQSPGTPSGGARSFGADDYGLGEGAAHNEGTETGSGDAEPALSLSDCLRSFTTLETLGEKIYCTGCAKNQDSQKQLFLATPPNVLILHLKRFDVLNDTKITTKVNIPLTDFDISEFIRADAATPATDEAAVGAKNVSPGCGDTSAVLSRADTMYDLQGVVSHSGTLHGGHYIAYTLDVTRSAGGARDKKQWIRCDDEVVTVVPEEEVLDAEAYVLFYVKKKFMVC